MSLPFINLTAGGIGSRRAIEKTDIFWLEKGMNLNACDIQIEQIGLLASCVKHRATKMGIALENIRSSPGAKIDWFH